MFLFRTIMQKSRSWSSAHDWKSCNGQKPFEGSNPSFSAMKGTSFVYQGKRGSFVAIIRGEWYTQFDKSNFEAETAMSLKLIKLTKEYESALAEMIDEWKEDQKINHTNHSPWAIFKNDYHDFDYYLENLEIKSEGDGKVPDSVFFLLDEDRNRLLGAVNIRHCLNEYLLREGGHIGDGIRPSERRKGYATEMIRLALIECKKLGMNKVLITCDRDNIGSAKSIINNGGILENEFVNSDGEIEQRYWITLCD